MDNKDKSLKENFSGLKDAFVYMIQSLMGKRTIDTYLSSLSDVTDKIITDSENEGLGFRSGVCTVSPDKEDSASISVEIKLDFDKSGKIVTKTAKRKVPRKKFTSGALEEIDGAGTLSYAIEHP